MALTPVCSVPKLRASPENMRCFERSFSTMALQALSHLQVPGTTFQEQPWLNEPVQAYT